jgi:hypothetical protein
MLKTTGIFLTGFLVLLVACARETTLKESSTFQDDIEFLQRYEEVLLLQDATGDKQVAVVPAWQGRVMTSTNSGPEGPSFGWINRDLIQTGATLPHINPYGGEDRFWMGPEGGQFSIFFKPGDPFDLEHWQTPAIVDTDRWSTTSSSTTSASFREEVSLTNYSGTNFNLRIDRTVRLLGAAEVSQLLGTAAPSGVQVVGFASENQITNIGETAWKKETGLLSIWILGMYVPSATTTVIIPFRQGPEKELGPIVNDSYFGKVPVDRLRVKGSAVYFTADGKYRSKIGLNPYRAAGIAGSFDSSRDLLTVIQYDQPEGLAEYVNSMWEIQEQPYAGDVINSYNDGPPEPGKKPMGPFYELETSSPAAALKPGDSISHVHRTYHFTGPSRQLDGIARKVLGVALADMPD